MRKLWAAVAAAGATAGVIPASGVSEATHYDCDTAVIGPGPNGWLDARASCGVGLQADDQMFRVRVTLINGSNVDTRTGEWRDCNNAVSETSWLQSNWPDHGDVTVEIRVDNKVGGC